MALSDYFNEWRSGVGSRTAGLASLLGIADHPDEESKVANTLKEHLLGNMSKGQLPGLGMGSILATRIFDMPPPSWASQSDSAFPEPVSIMENPSSADIAKQKANFIKRTRTADPTAQLSDPDTFGNPLRFAEFDEAVPGSIAPTTRVSWEADQGLHDDIVDYLQRVEDYPEPSSVGVIDREGNWHPYSSQTGGPSAPPTTPTRSSSIEAWLLR